MVLRKVQSVHFIINKTDDFRATIGRLDTIQQDLKPLCISYHAFLDGMNHTAVNKY